jgi:hypothetical protein
MSRLIQVTVGPLLAANSALIAASQTPLAAGNLVLVGGGAVLDQPRRVIISSAGADSAIVFVVYGTDISGQPLQATVTGVATPTPVDAGVSFATVTRISVSAATAGAITVGTNGVADSRPIFLDPFGFGPVLVHVYVSGTANYTMRTSQDDPNGVGGFGVPFGLQNVVWLNDSTLAAQAISSQVSLTAAPKLIQFTLNSGTGSFRATVTQHASPSI